MSRSIWLLLAVEAALCALALAAERTAVREAWLLLAGLVLTALAPALWRIVWRGSPLPDGPLRRQFLELARADRVAVDEIVVGLPGRLSTLAAASGWFPGLRYVFVAADLSARLSAEELLSVLAHEAGHLRHRHTLLRAVAVLAALAAALWLVPRHMAPAWSETQLAYLTHCGVRWLGVLVVAGGLFLWLSRRQEHEADLFACRALARRRGMAPGCDASVASAVAPCAEPHPVAGVPTLVMALAKLTAPYGHPFLRGTWTHGSVAQRQAFLLQLAASPTAENRFRRSMRWSACLVSGLAAAWLAVLAMF